MNDIDIQSLQKTIEDTLFQLGEDHAVVEIRSCNETVVSFDESSTKKIMKYLGTVPNGVLSYEALLKNKVCTSLNLGIVKTNHDTVIIRHLIRSSNESEKGQLLQTIYHLVYDIQGTVEEINSFPVWEYQKSSALREYLKNEYRKMFHKELEIEVTHAGLECGILASKKDGLDCVSIGPNVIDAHTPKERVEIESVNRMYEFLLSFLKNML